jgi:hypothetical protein
VQDTGLWVEHDAAAFALDRASRAARKVCIADEAAADARRAVARESNERVVTPRYHHDALVQNGWMLSKGASPAYRAAFTNAYVEAWEARYAALTS